MKLGKLFSSFSIGMMKIRNRIVMPPMATHYATPEGFVTDRQIAYYVERARGGVGYITVEHTGILQQGKASSKMLLISSDAVKGIGEHAREGFSAMGDGIGFEDAGAGLVPLVGLDGDVFSEKGPWLGGGAASFLILGPDGAEESVDGCCRDAV